MLRTVSLQDNFHCRFVIWDLDIHLANQKFKTYFIYLPLVFFCHLAATFRNCKQLYWQSVFLPPENSGLSCNIRSSSLMNTLPLSRTDYSRTRNQEDKSNGFQVGSLKIQEQIET